MVMTSEDLWIDFLTKIPMKTNIRVRQKLNEKLFTAKNSKLSYRQINSLDNDEMLESIRDSDKN